MKFKFVFTVFALLTMFCHMQAQPGTLYFSSETGDRFTLYVSGVRQNTIPALQVEALNVSGSVIPCMIAFENPGIPAINGNVGRNDVDVAFVISKDSKGAYTVYQKQTPTTLSNGVTISGTSSSGNTTTVKTNGGYVESVKSGSVEATDHSVKTDKFSVSSNVSVRVKTPEGMPGGMGGQPLPSYEEVNEARTVAGDYANSQTTTTTTTTNGSSNSQTVPPGTFYFDSEGIDSFYLWFNSKKVNETPQMHVEVYNVLDTWLNMRVEFTNRTYAPASKSMARWGRDVYYAIQRNNKGEHIIKLKNAVGDLKTPAPVTTQTVTTQTSYAPTSTFTFTSASVTTTTTTTYSTSVSTPSTSGKVSSPEPSASVNVPASTPVAQGSLKAELQGNKIVLSDGRKFTVNSFAGTSDAPHIKSSVLQGAKVTITYADGLDTYTATFPFDYTVPKREKYSQSAVITVDEGGADKTWSVNWKNSTWKVASIEP